jgi:hypothetical protein
MLLLWWEERQVVAPLLPPASLLERIRYTWSADPSTQIHLLWHKALASKTKHTISTRLTLLGQTNRDIQLTEIITTEAEIIMELLLTMASNNNICSTPVGFQLEGWHHLTLLHLTNKCSITQLEKEATSNYPRRMGLEAARRLYSRKEFKLSRLRTLIKTRINMDNLLALILTRLLTPPEVPSRILHLIIQEQSLKTLGTVWDSYKMLSCNNPSHPRLLESWRSYLHNQLVVAQLN